MNRQYYARIYLNKNPSPLDMSLLDTHEFLRDESKYDMRTVLFNDSLFDVRCSNGTYAGLLETFIEHNDFNQPKADAWVKIESKIMVQNGFWDSYLNGELQTGDSIKYSKIRLFSPISQSGRYNNYAFYMKIPEHPDPFHLKLYISTMSNFRGNVEEVNISHLEKKLPPK
jgi:hypothetical protein